MTPLHHEVPTHLNVEDKVLLGLTVRQFLYLLVGSSASYALWGQLASLGDGPRLAAVTVCLGFTVAFALARPLGRPLEEWVAAGLLYAIVPRRTTWRPSEPSLEDWRPALASWQELTPDPIWAEEEHG
jgi:hypothetical protein